MKATNLEVDFSNNLEDRVPDLGVFVPDVLYQALYASLHRRQDLQAEACNELAKLINRLSTIPTGALEAFQQEGAEFLGLKEKPRILLLLLEPLA